VVRWGFVCILCCSGCVGGGVTKLSLYLGLGVVRGPHVGGFITPVFTSWGGKALLT